MHFAACWFVSRVNFHQILKLHIFRILCCLFGIPQSFSSSYELAWPVMLSDLEVKISLLHFSLHIGIDFLIVFNSEITLLHSISILSQLTLH